MVKTRLTTLSAKHRIPLKYCSRDTDRHGNERFYIRLPNKHKYRMLSPYLDDNGSMTKAFIDEYHRFISGEVETNSKAKPTYAVGTISWLVDLPSI